MNKTLLFAAAVAGALGVAATAAAQPKLVKKWESDASFKVPESVYFDKAGKVLYVSNIDGEPWGKDGAGSIGKLGLDGKVIAAEWVKGLQRAEGHGAVEGHAVGRRPERASSASTSPRARSPRASRSRAPRGSTT